MALTCLGQGVGAWWGPSTLGVLGVWEGLGFCRGDTAGPSSGTSHSGGNGVEPRIKMGRHHWAGKQGITQDPNVQLQGRHPPLGRSCCVSALGAASGRVPVLGVSGSCLPARLHRPPLPTWSVTLSVCSLCAAECTRPASFAVSRPPVLTKLSREPACLPGLWVYSLCVIV